MLGLSNSSYFWAVVSNPQILNMQPPPVFLTAVPPMIPSGHAPFEQHGHNLTAR